MDSQTHSVRLSSKLTTLSKVSLPLLGIPIALTIPLNTNYAIWAILASISLAVFCIYISKILTNASLAENKLQFEGLFSPPVTVAFSEIVKFKKINSRRYLYFYFKTSLQSFLVIAPLWGDGRKALMELYEKYQQIQS